MRLFSVRRGLSAFFVVSLAVGLTTAWYVKANDPSREPGSSSEANIPEIKLEGTGRQATEKFELQAGLAFLQTESAGSSNFVVYLVDSQGNEIDTLFNQIDKFTGRTAFNVKKTGTYLLNVQATGPWSFTFEQPRPESAEPTPQEFQGQGYDVTPFVQLKSGLNVFKYQHQGEGRASFTLLDKDGRAIEQIANQLDEFKGSQSVKIEEEGIYFLRVAAEGAWTVDIE